MPTYHPDRWSAEAENWTRITDLPSLHNNHYITKALGTGAVEAPRYPSSVYDYRAGVNTSSRIQKSQSIVCPLLVGNEVPPCRFELQLLDYETSVLAIVTTGAYLVIVRT